MPPSQSAAVQNEQSQGLHRVSTPSEEDEVERGSSDFNPIRVADTVAGAQCLHESEIT